MAKKPQGKRQTGELDIHMHMVSILLKPCVNLKTRLASAYVEIVACYENK